jgi:hypothetical protein
VDLDEASASVGQAAAHLRSCVSWYVSCL